MYELIKNELGSVIKWTRENGIISFIPLDESNPDYLDYLKTLDN
jgi:hypothetical protein